MVALLSCSTVSKDTQQQLSADKFYKRDMIIHVNDQEGIGTLVVKEAAKYIANGTSRRPGTLKRLKSVCFGKKR